MEYITWNFRLPTADGLMIDLGETSPANPARNVPDPLSMTTASIDSSSLMTPQTSLLLIPGK